MSRLDDILTPRVICYEWCTWCNSNKRMIDSHFSIEKNEIKTLILSLITNTPLSDVKDLYIRGVLVGENRAKDELRQKVEEL